MTGDKTQQQQPDRLYNCRKIDGWKAKEYVEAKLHDGKWSGTKVMAMSKGK